MEIIGILIIKLIPLYLLILLGMIVSQKLKVNRESVAKLLVYIISPGVVFYGTCKADLNLSNLLLPIVFFALSCISALLFFQIGKYFWKDNTKNILAYTAGTANTGYFGLPVLLMLFGENSFTLAALAIFGFILYENTLGFYITARGNFSAKQSLMKVLKLPAIYTFIAGLTFNFLKIPISADIFDMLGYFKGAYSLLGMMIIGMSLSRATFQKFDFKFLTLSFIARFIFWPLILLPFVYFDKTIFHFFTNEAYHILLVYSCVPLAASTVVFASELGVQPDKAAVTVLLSTLFALFYIPMVIFL